jgi:hypothetical protein
MDLTAIPQLARGVRFSDAAGEETTLMVPEGILRLKGPGRRIVELCNGNRTIADIVEVLTAEYSAGDPVPDASSGQASASILVSLWLLPPTR